jgi:hypothetical protein
MVEARVAEVRRENLIVTNGRMELDVLEDLMK